MSNQTTRNWDGSAAGNKQNSNSNTGNDGGRRSVAATAQQRAVKPPGRPAPEQRPEWVDARRAGAIFCLSRSTLYRLADEGKLSTVSLRERGKLRGKRLFSYDGLSNYLNSRATGGENPPA